MRRLALLAAVACLTAEANGRTTPQLPARGRAQVRYALAEIESFDARRRLLDESVASLNRSIAMLGKELQLSQTMAAKA